MHSRSNGQATTSFGTKPTPKVQDLFPQDPRYEIIGDPIVGGMGIVFKARDKWLDRVLALKRIRPEYALEQAIVSRFEKEAKVLDQVNHENVVKVINLDKDEVGPLLVMPWTDGESLMELIKKEKKLAPALAVHIIEKICDGLHAVHSLGITHRDIKPDNILISKYDPEKPAEVHPLLIDFGLVRIESQSVPSMATISGALLGTFEFVSPEQVESPQAAGPASDQWSLAATLYMCLTGLPVRARDDELLPESLRPIVVRALRPNPSERFESVQEFGLALLNGLYQPTKSRTTSEDSSASDTAKPEEQEAAPKKSLLETLKEKEAAHQRLRTEIGSMVREKMFEVAMEKLADESVPKVLRDSLTPKVAEAWDLEKSKKALDKEIRASIDQMQYDLARDKARQLLKIWPDHPELHELLATLPNGMVKEICSPMVGTVYTRRTPSAKDFVQVGSKVREETVVCMIEAMNVFMDIPAELNGIILNAMIQNGDTVDVGQPIFKIEILN